jgi:hypothetical protein
MQQFEAATQEKEEWIQAEGILDWADQDGAGLVFRLHENGHRVTAKG